MPKLIFWNFLFTEFSTTSSILEQIGIDKPLRNDPGVSNFARIPLTKFQMSSQNPSSSVSDDVPTPEPVTFAPDTVTISAVNNEGATRILEVVKIVKPTEEEPSGNLSHYSKSLIFVQ